MKKLRKLQKISSITKAVQKLFKHLIYSTSTVDVGSLSHILQPSGKHPRPIPLRSNCTRSDLALLRPGAFAPRAPCGRLSRLHHVSSTSRLSSSLVVSARRRGAAPARRERLPLLASLREADVLVLLVGTEKKHAAKNWYTKMYQAFGLGI